MSVKSLWTLEYSDGFLFGQAEQQTSEELRAAFSGSSYYVHVLLSIVPKIEWNLTNTSWDKQMKGLW